MQKARIRTGWKNKNKEISMEELAGATGAICWRMALNAAKNLHEQDFEYETDNQRLEVMQCYLFFYIHCADRLSFNKLTAEQRMEYINFLAKDCKRHLFENLEQIHARKTQFDGFFEQLNQANDSYSRCQFPNDMPGYEAYRLLGSHVQTIMCLSQTNKWVIHQVMEIDGPNAFDIFKSSMTKLFRNSKLN